MLLPPGRALWRRDGRWVPGKLFTSSDIRSFAQSMPGVPEPLNPLEPADVRTTQSFIHRRLPRIVIRDGETEHVSYSGVRKRQPTVLIHVGRYQLSKRAFLLGALLALCQLLDGILTYLGLSLRGVEMEGNALLRTLMLTYGKTSVLFFAKLVALVGVLILTLCAHRRRWIRPLIAFLVVVYLCMAVFPWIYIISATYAQGS